MGEPIRIPSSLAGLLEQATCEQPWTAERQEQFLETFVIVLDYAWPASDRVEDEESDDTDDVDDEDVTEKRTGSNVKWFDVMRQLVANEIDHFECTKRASSAPGIKSELCRKYPGVVVKITPVDEDTSTLTVRVGAYRG